jgi:hypothetical protein
MTMLKATLGGVMVEAVRSLLPPACREHVLGDLQERYRSPFAYLMDAATAVPAAIIGEVLRVTPLPFILLEAMLVYASFFIAGYSQRSLGPIWADAQLSQLAIMTGLVMTWLLWRDSHEQPPARGALRAAARLRRELRLKRTSFRFRLLVASVRTPVDSPFYSNSIWAVFPLALFLFPASHLFPGPMTVFRGVLIAALLIYPLRIWFRMRRQSRTATH